MDGEEDATCSAAVAAPGEDELEGPLDYPVGMMADALDAWPLVTAGTYVSRSSARECECDTSGFVVAALRDRLSHIGGDLAPGVAIYRKRGDDVYFSMLGHVMLSYADTPAIPVKNDVVVLVAARSMYDASVVLGLLWLARGIFEPLPAEVSATVPFSARYCETPGGDMLLLMYMFEPGRIDAYGVAMGRFEERAVRWHASFAVGAREWYPGVARFVGITGSHLCVAAGVGALADLVVDPVLGPLGADGAPDPDGPWVPCPRVVADSSE